MATPEARRAERRDDVTNWVMEAVLAYDERVEASRTDHGTFEFGKPGNSQFRVVVEEVDE